MDYVELGSFPEDESGVEVSVKQPYFKAMRKECRRYKRMLQNRFPGFRSFAIRSFSHAFGKYYEVVFYFNPDDSLSSEIAFWIEDNLPATWDDNAVLIYPSNSELYPNSSDSVAAAGAADSSAAADLPAAADAVSAAGVAKPAGAGGIVRYNGFHSPDAEGCYVKYSDVSRFIESSNPKFFNYGFYCSHCNGCVSFPALFCSCCGSRLSWRKSL